jgi:hypothetical protein
MMFASPAKFRSWTAIYLNSIRLGQVMRARKRQQLESTARENEFKKLSHHENGDSTSDLTIMVGPGRPLN